MVSSSRSSGFDNPTLRESIEDLGCATHAGAGEGAISQAG